MGVGDGCPIEFCVKSVSLMVDAAYRYPQTWLFNYYCMGRELPLRPPRLIPGEVYIWDTNACIHRLGLI